MLERSRFMVGDAAWEKIAPLLPGKASDPGATAKDNRLFLEAVLWRVRTGVPWRDLPSDFGHWNSVFQRFRRWVKGGVFARVFECLSDEPDFESLWVTFPAACGVSPSHDQRRRQEAGIGLPEATREPPIGSLLKYPAACGGDPLLLLKLTTFILSILRRFMYCGKK